MCTGYIIKMALSSILMFGCFMLGFALMSLSMLLLANTDSIFSPLLFCCLNAPRFFCLELVCKSVFFPILVCSVFNFSWAELKYSYSTGLLDRFSFSALKSKASNAFLMSFCSLMSPVLIFFADGEAAKGIEILWLKGVRPSGFKIYLVLKVSMSFM